MTKLTQHKEDIYKCTKCGLCQSVCPVYEVTGKETTVSRGFFSLLNGIIKGDLSFNKKTSKYLDMCLMCNACYEYCPSGINPEEIILAAKEESFNKNGLSFSKKILAFCFANKNILKTISLMISAYKTFRLNTITDFLTDKRIKLFNKLIKENVKYKKNKPIKKSKLKVVYFPGCVNNYINPSAKNAVKIVLEANGIDVIIPDFDCCGLPIRNMGDINTFKKIAQQNLDKIDSNIDYLITDCASCGAVLKDYSKYFNNKKTKLLKEKSININEFLIKENIEMPSSSAFEAKVTYHDPCHLSRNLGIAKEPREILKNMSNVAFTEMKEADKCCGAAGTFCIVNPKISQQISDKKAKNIINSGADIVCTSCSGCTVGLYQGLIGQNSDIEVFQTIELLAKSY